MAKTIRMGHHKDGGGEFKGVDWVYTSGWDGEKIMRWRGANMCEEGAHWVKPSIKRKF